jgi:hypothetical protein
MRDLVLLLHKIDLRLDGWIVLVLVFSDLEKNLDLILRPLLDICFVQDVAELIEDRVRDGPVHLFHKLPDLSRDADGDFYTFVGRLMQQQQ